ncbi:MAG: hypothetical protein ACFNVZ_07005, partial [Prevotella melaninogenica]
YSTKSNSKFTAKNLELLRVTLLKVLKTNGKPYHSKLMKAPICPNFSPTNFVKTIKRHSTNTLLAC